MSVLSDSPDASDGLVLARIRAAAEQTLAVWPEARAAVLFGSRARGDHRPDSDWDLAFITTGPEGRVGAVPPGLPTDGLPSRVDRLTLPEALARRKASSIGHVALGVVRDGQLLAGAWDRPELGEGEEHMEAYEYSRFIRHAARLMKAAAQIISEIGNDDWEEDATACNEFVVNSADAGEYLAKAMLGRHGIDYARTHIITQLASQAEDAGLHDLSRVVASLNGASSDQHTASYGGANVAASKQAAARLVLVAGYLGDEIGRAAEDPALAETAARLYPTVLARIREGLDALDTARALSPAPGAPEEERARIDVLVRAREPLVKALAALEGRLAHEAGHDLPEPSPLADASGPRHS